MKPTAFVITLPVASFSKHDNPEEVAEEISNMLKIFLRHFDKQEGGSPFDYENMKTEAVYGPGRGAEETTGTVGSIPQDGLPSSR